MSQPQYQGPPPAQPAQTNVVAVSQQQPVYSGGCSRCGSTATKDSFTCCGILLAILFFPLGLICCLLMTEKQCANCGASV